MFVPGRLFCARLPRRCIVCKQPGDRTSVQRETVYLISKRSWTRIELSTTYNRLLSSLCPSAGYPSISLAGHKSLFFSHNALSSAKALAWCSLAKEGRETKAGFSRPAGLTEASAAMLARVLCVGILYTSDRSGLCSIKGKVSKPSYVCRLMEAEEHDVSTVQTAVLNESS